MLEQSSWELERATILKLSGVEKGSGLKDEFKRSWLSQQNQSAHHIYKIKAWMYENIWSNDMKI